MKIISYKAFILTSITALMVTFSISSHAKIYKWMDNKGQTNYTATPPPPDQNAENIEKDIKANAGKYQAPREGEEEPVKEEKPEQKAAPLAGPPKQLIEYCDSTRKQLKTLQENFRILFTDEKGEQTRLSQEEREQKVKDTQAKLAEDCSDVPPAT